MRDNCICLLFDPSITKKNESKIESIIKGCVCFRGETKVACFKHNTKKPTIPYIK